MDNFTVMRCLTQFTSSTPAIERLPFKATYRCRVRTKICNPHMMHVLATKSRSSQPTSPQTADIKDVGFEDSVKFARMASPYIIGHSGRTFVVQIPGWVVASRDILSSHLNDIALLHDMGVNLVLVLGATEIIDQTLRANSSEPHYVKGYRVTDTAALKAALEVMSMSITEAQACLSKAPEVSMVRRHTRTGQKVRYTPGLQVVTGNYITAKKRGALNGTNFGYTGKVRFMQVDAIREQLAAGNIVILGNLGYSVAGELLNCSSYDIATHAAVELKADKLICLTGQEVVDLGLPFWMPLADAEQLIMQRYCRAMTNSDDCSLASPLHMAASGGDTDDEAGMATGSEFDLDDWAAVGLPTSVVAAVAACKNGVKRTHLVDARTDGALLIELFSQEGFGTMFSQDLYSGIRAASWSDFDAVRELLLLLGREGIQLDVVDSDEALGEHMRDMTIVEVEGHVVACAWLQNLGRAPDGVKCAEVMAFIVHPLYRNAGRGDSLLDYMEQVAREQGIRRLIMCSNKSIDWFEQRQFLALERGLEGEVIPVDRKMATESNGEQLSQLYTKEINELEAEAAAPAGKRIGY